MAASSYLVSAMTSRTVVRTSLLTGAATLFMAACGGAPVGSDSAAESVALKVSGDVLAVTVLHGDDAGHYQIAWDAEPADTTVRIEVSTDPNFAPGTGQVIDVEDDALNTDWHTDGANERRYFAFIPEGGELVRSAVRLLPLEGGRNFRDLGGYETEDGRVVKWGQVYRSGVMSGLTDADYDYLKSLGVRVICDFRESDERSREPTDWRANEVAYLTFADPETGGDPIANPMFEALMSPDATAEDVAAGMAAGYVSIAKDEREGYTQMFDRLAGGDIPLAFNCSAGKDRAGTAAALLLTALGVPRETVVHDYSLSDDYVDFMSEFLNEESRAQAASDPDYPYAFLFQLPPEKVAPLMASDPIYIESTFTALEAEYGSVLNYIQTELDVTDEELASIRAALLE